MLFVSLGILAAYLSLGAVPLPLSDIIETLYIAVTEGEAAARDAHPKVVAILFYIRGPRALAAILAGGGLALAGRLMLEERASAISKPLYSIPVITSRTKLIQGGCGF